MKAGFTVATFGILVFSALISAAEREPEVEMLQPGVRLTLVAEHPDIATPTGVDVDDEGRVWAVACHTHFPPKEYEGPKFDEILVFDGKGGRRVFYNATHHTMDLELGEDGWVYLAERDRIFRVRDSDGDGRGDVEENLAELVTEADYPHNGLSALAWHPGGDLLFGLGENYAKSWTLTGRDGVEYTGVGEGGVFRFRPDGTQLRRVARGLWNPFGLLVREDGEIFAAENDPGERPPCRLLHIVEGGDYGYQRLYGPSAHHPFVCWNGELRGTLPMIHPSGEAPCGVARLGRGLIVPSWSDHRVDFYPLKRKGASYSSGRIALARGARYFRPVCIARDRSQADGRILTWYLTDWVDGRYAVHGFGRLWKLEIDLEEATWAGPLDLEPPNEAAKLAANLRGGKEKYSRGDLMRLAREDDPFVARAALLALAREASGWTWSEIGKLAAPDRVSAVMALKLAKVAPEPWVAQFLGDEKANVRFETLRWIADEQLNTFLPEVEAMLKRSDLEFELFEAAVATWNTLSGKAEAGVRDTAMLLDRVRDEESAPRVRAYALRLLPEQPRVASNAGEAPIQKFPKGLTIDLLRQLLALGDEALSLEVVRTLGGNPGEGEALLAALAADAGQSIELRAEAIAGLGAVAEKQRDLLVRIAGEESSATIREEALRSLRTVTIEAAEKRRLKEVAAAHPDSEGLMRAILEPGSLSLDRPALGDTAGWLKRIEAVEGPADPENGRRIFHSRVALCSSCHRHGGRGNVVGPDLSALGDQGDRASLLESILDPNREVAPEYLPRTITLKDGTTFTGIRLRSSTAEAMRDTNGQNRSFNRDDIVEMEELQVSFMPAGLAYSLTDRELRDLMAFLENSSDDLK